MNFDLIKKEANFNWEKVNLFEDSGGELNYSFDLEPEDFLHFADIDMESGNDHGLINALSNAKRAINCSTDKVLKIFNLKPEKNNFPSRVSLLQEIGIIAPRIMHKVVRSRNLLEHEYKLPETDEEVEDAIDIANLFVSSVNGALRNAWTDFYIKEGNDYDDELENAIYFSFDEKNKSWEVELYKGNGEFKTSIDSKHKDYKSIVKLLFCEGKNSYKEREVLLELGGIK